MSAKIIDGKAIAATMREELKDKVASLTEAGHQPGLGVLLVGDDPASRSYVTAKERACENLGIYSNEVTLPQDASLEDILGVVDTFNRDERIHGILVQLPLPNSEWEDEVLQRIHPDKDVDGFHPTNVGRMLLDLPAYLPCTPHGILHLLDRSGVDISGKHAVVVGRSRIVGKPMVNLLFRKNVLGNATVTVCHTGTDHLKKHVEQADIVIAAAGRPDTVTADMIKPGAVVIDVGVNRVEDASRKRGYRLVGDVDFEGASERASLITPVPGGVGPMTITMLLFNTVEAAARKAGE